MPDPTTDTALAINTLQIAVTTLSADIHEIKGMLRNQNERLSGAVSALSEWKAAHEASGPSSHAFESVTGRVTNLETRVATVEDRQTTARTLTLTAIGGTVVALAKAFLTGKP